MSIHEFIDREVKGNDVVVFMKGTPQFPQCGFSGQVVQILDHLGVEFIGVDVLPQQGINVYDILRRDTLVLTRDAVKHLEERLK